MATEKTYTEQEVKAKVLKGITQAMTEFVQAYYIRCSANPTVSEIMGWLESDREHLQQEAALIEAEEILNTVLWPQNKLINW